MATVVVKLGSSIVADDSGEVRADVLAVSYTHLTLPTNREV